MSDENGATDDAGASIPFKRRDYLKAVGATGALSLVSGEATAASISVGNGSYRDDLPSNESEPPATKYTTSNVSAPIPTNDWWSSMVWDAFGYKYFAHPLMAEPHAGGLDIAHLDGASWSYGTDCSSREEVAQRKPAADFTVTHAEETASDAWSQELVNDYGDWHVQNKFVNSSYNAMWATLVQGSPFAYFEYYDGGVAVKFGTAPNVWADKGNYLGIEINGNNHGLYAPGDADWSGIGTSTLTSGLGSGTYMTVAMLPAQSASALDDFATYAHRHVTGTQVSWSYDEANAEVNTTYSYTVDDKTGSGGTATLTGLYPHQYRHGRLDDALLSKTYRTEFESPRGTMKLLAGSSFSTTMTYPGILPHLPDEGTYDQATLENYVSNVSETFDDSNGDGTYWTGKDYGRMAEAVPVAQQVGNSTKASNLVSAMQSELENWLTAGSSETEDVFYYNSNWGTFIGYNDSFGAAADINDHHFHYGYFLRAAAAVSRYKQAVDGNASWDDEANWGGMVNLMIRDIANPVRPDESNPQDPSSYPGDSFPFLRNFSPFAGHSWAAGGAEFDCGNNHESSSEAVNAWANLIRWGEYTGQSLNGQSIRDLGVYLYTHEVAAIKEYWYDQDDVTQPPETDWGHDHAIQVWGSGYAFDIWWNGSLEEHYGINWLPLSGHSLYLGHDTSEVKETFDNLVSDNGGSDTFSTWRDLIWEYNAFQDPTWSVNKFANNSGYTKEAGESKAHTYHYIHNLDGMGSPRADITSDHVMSAVFEDPDGNLTYVAYNAGGSSITVTFSDGESLGVGAHTMATKTVSPQSPYGRSSPWPIPGTIEAEDYDTGGSGAAYSDSDAGNNGGAYRSDDVDIESTQDSTGAYNVGWTAGGEWLEYTVSVDADGKYDFAFRVASNGGGGPFHVEMDGTDVTGSVSVPDTGGWQTWTTVTVSDVSLTAGEHVMRLAVDTGGFNINYIDVSSSSTTTQLDRSGWTPNPSHSYFSDNGGRAIDGDSSTEWASGIQIDAATIVFEVDMGATETFDEIQIDHVDPANSSGSDPTYPATLDIEVSSDGSSWTTVASGVSGSQNMSVTFSAQSAQYFRIVDTQSTSSDEWWKILELRAYNTS